MRSSRVSKDFAASLVSNAKWFVWQVWKSWHCTTENDFYATAVGVLLFRAASEQQTAAAAAAAARRSKCRAWKKTSKGPPEALWFMEAHRKRFKFEERWGYCHLFMRTSQPMIMGRHDFWRRIILLNYLTIRYDTIRYDTIRYDTIRYDTMRYNMLQWDVSNMMLKWYGMMRYDTIRYYKIWYDTIQHDKIK